MFRDAALQAEFDEKGYVVVPLLTLEQVDDLYSYYKTENKRMDGYNGTYAEFSVLNAELSHRKKIFDKISGTVVFVFQPAEEGAAALPRRNRKPGESRVIDPLHPEPSRFRGGHRRGLGHRDDGGGRGRQAARGGADGRHGHHHHVPGGHPPARGRAHGRDHRARPGGAGAVARHWHRDARHWRPHARALRQCGAPAVRVCRQ